MINYSALVLLYVTPSIALTLVYFLRDKKFSTLAVGFGVTGWILDSQSGFELLAYGLQFVSAVVTLLYVIRYEPLVEGNYLSRILLWMQRCTYVYIFAQVVSALITSSGIEGTVRSALLFLLIRALRSFFSNENAPHVLPLLIATVSTTTILLDSVFSVTQISVTEIGGGRFGGVIGHPNYAAYLSAAACIAWFGKRPTTLSVGATLVTGLATVLTLSRTAIVALLVSLVFVAFRKRKLRQGIVTGIIAVSLLFFQSNLLNALSERFGWIVESGGLFGSNSAGWRRLQWTTTMEVIQEKNFAPVGWKQSGQYLLSGLEPHNFYLQAQLELGVLGLLSAVWLTILFLVGSINLRNFPPLILVAFGCSLDAGFLVPSFFIAAMILFTEYVAYYKLGTTIGHSKTSVTRQQT